MGVRLWNEFEVLKKCRTLIQFKRVVKAIYVNYWLIRAGKTLKYYT